MPAVLAKTIIENNNSGYEDAVLILPKIQNAKEYVIQIDDNLNFISPEIEKTVNTNKDKAIFRLKKRRTPYYWRYQVKNVNGEVGEWKNQLELKKYIPDADKMLIMDGRSYKISDPINFYFFIRNMGSLFRVYEYSVSIRTDVIINNESRTETRDVIYNKVTLAPDSYRLVRAEMKANDFLEVNKKYHAIARIDDYETAEDFYIEPSYKADIITSELERGTGKKVKLYITNTSDDEIKTLKASISTSYNIVVNGWWDKKEADNIKSGAVEYFEWDADITELSKSEIDIDIFSDGGTQRLRKVFMPYSGALVVKEVPDVDIFMNEISDIKLRIANISDISQNENIELAVTGMEGSEGKMEILDKYQTFKAGAGSVRCSNEFLDDCSADLVWKIIGKRAGTYEYYLTSRGYDIKISGENIVKHGVIHVMESDHALDLTINGNQSLLEKKSNKKEPFSYDLQLYNYSANADMAKIRITPKGKGWYVHFYDGNELKNGSEFETDIDADSSKMFRLILNPQSNDPKNFGTSVTNPFETQISVVSLKNASNSDQVRAVAEIE